MVSKPKYTLLNLRFLFQYKVLFILGTLWFIIASLFSYFQFIGFGDLYDANGAAQQMSWLIHGYVPWHYCLTCFTWGHLSLLMYLLAPFYLLSPSVLTLNIIQNFLIAFTSVPLYFLARRHLTGLFPIGITLAYLCNPMIWATVYEGFHVEALVIPFSFMVIYFLDTRNGKMVLLSSILLLFDVEYGAVILALILVYNFIRTKPSEWKLWSPKVSVQRWQFFPVFTIVGIFFSAIYYLISSNILKSTGFDPTSLIVSGRFNLLPITSVFQLPFALVEYPSLALASLQTNLVVKILDIVFLYGTTFFSSFLSPASLILSPWLLVSLFSTYIYYSSPYLFYAGFIAFAVFPTSVFGIKRLVKWFPRFRTIILFALIFMTLIGGMETLLIAIPPNPNLTSTTGWNQVISLIPNNATVVATQDVGSHLTTDINAYLVDFVVSHQDQVNFFKISNQTTFTYILFDNNSLNPYDISTAHFLYHFVLSTHHYFLYASSDNLYLYKYVNTQTYISSESVCSPEIFCVY